MGTGRSGSSAGRGTAGEDQPSPARLIHSDDGQRSLIPRSPAALTSALHTHTRGRARRPRVHVRLRCGPPSGAVPPLLALGLAPAGAYVGAKKTAGQGRPPFAVF